MSDRSQENRRVQATEIIEAVRAYGEARKAVRDMSALVPVTDQLAQMEALSSAQKVLDSVAIRYAVECSTPEESTKEEG